MPGSASLPAGTPCPRPLSDQGQVRRNKTIPELKHAVRQLIDRFSGALGLIGKFLLDDTDRHQLGNIIAGRPRVIQSGSPGYLADLAGSGGNGFDDRTDCGAAVFLADSFVV